MGHNNFRILGAALFDGGLAFGLIRRDEGNISIATSVIKEPNHTKYSGVADKAEDDQPILGVGYVFVKNLSLVKSVTMRFFLVGKDNNGVQQFKYEGDGKDLWGRTISDDRGWAADMKKHHGLSTKYILSPLMLKPQDTIDGYMIFLMPFRESDQPPWANIRDRIVGDVVRGQLHYSLEIEDAISGAVETISLPGRFQGTP
jgi:hypothetical protein